MYNLKTKETTNSVTAFLHGVEDEQKRKDCFEIAGMMQQATGLQPKMWGLAIVGFGSYHYKYESGHEGDMCLMGFSPRKQNISLYVSCDLHKYDSLLEKLGKHKTGKGCLYIHSLDKVDRSVLNTLITTALAYIDNK